MGLKDAVLDGYYSLIDSLENAGIPANKYFVEPIESRGIPLLPVFAVTALLFLAGAVFLASLLFQPASSLKLVVTSGGEPVEGAVAAVVLDDGASLQQVTSAGGVAEFAALRGKSASVSVKKKGYSDAQKKISLSPGEKTVSFSLEASAQPVAITLKVFDDLAKPVGGASIAYSYAVNGKPKSGTATSNAGGTARFEALSGSVSVKVSKAGFVSSEKTFSFASNSTKEIVLVRSNAAENASIEFHEGTGGIRVLLLTADSGKVLSGAIVRVVDSSTKQIIAEKTSSFGLAVFPDLSLGKRVLVSAQADGFTSIVSGEQRVAESTSLTLRLERGAFEPATVVCAKLGDEGVAGAKIELLSRELIEVSEGASQVDGCLTFVNLDESREYYAIVSKEGFLSVYSLFFQAGSAVEVSMERVTPLNSAKLRVLVSDDSGLPVRNASVSVYDDAFGVIIATARQIGTNGIAEFTALPIDIGVNVQASDGASTVNAPAALDNSTVAVQLILPSPTAFLIINATDAETGLQVENSLALAFDVAADTDYSNASHAYSQCGGGQCQLNLRAGQASSFVIVRAKGYLDYSFSQQRLAPDESRSAQVSLEAEYGAQLVDSIRVLNYDAISPLAVQSSDSLSFGGTCVNVIVLRAGTQENLTVSAIDFSSRYSVDENGIVTTPGRVRFLDDACSPGLDLVGFRILGYIDATYNVSRFTFASSDSISFRNGNQSYCAELELQYANSSTQAAIASQVDFDGAYSIDDDGTVNILGANTRLHNDYCNPRAITSEASVKFIGLFDSKGASASTLKPGAAYTAKLRLSVKNALVGGAYLRIGDEVQESGSIVDFYGYNSFESGGKNYTPPLACESLHSTLGAPFKWASLVANYKPEGETKELSYKLVATPQFGDQQMSLHYRGYAQKFSSFIRDPLDADLLNDESNNRKAYCNAETYSKEFRVEKGGAECNEEGCIEVTLSQPAREEIVDGKDDFTAHSVARCILDASALSGECPDGPLVLDYKVRTFRKGETYTKLSFKVDPEAFQDAPSEIDLSDGEVFLGTVQLIPVRAKDSAKIELVLSNDADERTNKLSYSSSVKIVGEEVSINNTPQFDVDVTPEVSITVRRGAIAISVPEIKMQVDSVFPVDAIPLVVDSDGSCTLLVNIVSKATRPCYSLSADNVLEFRANEVNPACPIKAVADKIAGDSTAKLSVACTQNTVPAQIPIRVTGKNIPATFIKPSSLAGSAAKIFHLISQKQLGTRTLSIQDKLVSFDGSNALSLVMTGEGSFDLKDDNETITSLSYSSKDSYFKNIDTQGPHIDGCQSQYCCAEGWCEKGAASSAFLDFKQQAAALAKATAFRRKAAADSNAHQNNSGQGPSNPAPEINLLEVAGVPSFNYTTIIRLAQGASLPSEVQFLDSPGDYSCESDAPRVYVVQASTTDGAAWKYTARIPSLSDASYLDAVGGTNPTHSCTGEGQAEGSRLGSTPLCGFLQGNENCVESTPEATFASAEQLKDEESQKIIPIPSAFWKASIIFRNACNAVSKETTGVFEGAKATCALKAGASFGADYTACLAAEAVPIAQNCGALGGKAGVDFDLPGVFPVPRTARYSCIPVLTLAPESLGATGSASSYVGLPAVEEYISSTIRANPAGECYEISGPAAQGACVEAQLPAEIVSGPGAVMRMGCVPRCTPRTSYTFTTTCGNKIYAILHIGLTENCGFDGKGAIVQFAALGAAYAYPEHAETVFTLGSLYNFLSTIKDRDVETGATLKAFEDPTKFAVANAVASQLISSVVCSQIGAG